MQGTVLLLLLLLYEIILVKCHLKGINQCGDNNNISQGQIRTQKIPLLQIATIIALIVVVPFVGSIPCLRLGLNETMLQYLQGIDKVIFGFDGSVSRQHQPPPTPKSKRARDESVRLHSTIRKYNRPYKEQ